jgi:ATP-binding cassette subfamily F protein 3
MIVIRLNAIKFAYASEPIFEDLNFSIHDDRCIGLIGPNGSGKTSLMKIIIGDVALDEGHVSRNRRTNIAYMPQEIDFDPTRTVLETVGTASTDLMSVNQSLQQIESQLGDPKIYSNPKALQKAIDRQSNLLEEYVLLGGPGYENNVRTILSRLGFDEQELDLPVDALSGGQKKLLAFAILVLQQPDILLLDEPDNHLDLDGKAILEQFIRDYSGGVIIISHDRYLLDLLVDEIVEIEGGRLNVYQGNYSEYAVEKQVRALRQQQLHLAQAKEIDRLETSAHRLLTWGRVYDNNKFIRRGNNILKRLERMEKVDRPVLEPDTMILNLKGWRGSTKVLEIQALQVAFHDQSDMNQQRTIIQDLNLLVQHGERVGVVGRNGAGKTILFKVIRGEIQPTQGKIILGPSVKMGYYAQQHETLDANLSLIEIVRKTAPLSEGRAVAFLNRFRFGYLQQRDMIGKLSGGERSRMQLALIMLGNPNFLLLDEPTNNLDIPSAEVLEEVLSEFQGTILVISHDRYFLDAVVGRIVELEDCQLFEYGGNYSDYETRKFSTEAKI